MAAAALEVADIFRAHGPAWKLTQRNHLSLGQLKVMSAIEQCRTAALGGHALRCLDCGDVEVSYNSCRNRHCPKCQSSAAKRWLDARQADLLPVDYYHVVFTLPAPISAIAYYNKAVVYGMLFDVAAQTLGTIAADTRHLGAQVGATLVLHTWGSALTHHPHVHGIVPGGGLSLDGTRWVSCKPGFFLPVRVLSRLFRRQPLGKGRRISQMVVLAEELQLACAMCLLQLFNKPAPEQTRKHPNREEEPRLAGNPPRAVQRQTSAGNNPMHVRMVRESRAPRVQNQRHAHLRTQVPGVGGDHGQCLCRHIEQHAVDHGLVVVGDITDGRR